SLPGHVLCLPVRLRPRGPRRLAGRGAARARARGPDRAGRRRVQLPARRTAAQAALGRPAACDAPARGMAAPRALAHARPGRPHGGRTPPAPPAVPVAVRGAGAGARDGGAGDLGMTGLRRMGTWAMKRALFHSGLLSLAELARGRNGAVVLRYHAITDGVAEVPYATPDICLPVEVFRLQMAFVKRAYSVLALDELVERLERRSALPPRALAITFDDGYADNHRLALPVLRALGLHATLYIATAAVDGGPPPWI